MTRLAALPVAIVGALALAAGTALAGDTIAGDPVAGNTGAERASAGCSAPPALMLIEPAQARVAARIGRGEALTIVAVGSSSTQEAVRAPRVGAIRAGSRPSSRTASLRSASG